MATKFEEIYPLFLSQITDDDLGNLEREEVLMVAHDYIIRSIINVQEVETDLTDIDIANEQFNNDLTLLEKLIVAKSMKLEWVKDRIYQEDLMRQNIGDRDYKAVQGTGYLDALRVLQNNLMKELRQDLLRNDWGKSSSYDRMM